MEPMMVIFGGVIVALNIVPAIVRTARNVNNKHRGRPHSRNRFEGHEKTSEEEGILDDETYDPAYSSIPFNIYHDDDDHHRH